MLLPLPPPLLLPQLHPMGMAVCWQRPQEHPAALLMPQLPQLLQQDRGKLLRWKLLPGQLLLVKLLLLLPLQLVLGPASELPLGAPAAKIGSEGLLVAPLKQAGPAGSQQELGPLA